MNPTKRNYRGTFILDDRGKPESLDQLIESLKQEIAAVDGEVTAVESLGRRDFVRPINPKFTAAPYVQVDFSAPTDAPSRLQGRIRLNSNVHRAFVQAV